MPPRVLNLFLFLILVFLLSFSAVSIVHAQASSASAQPAATPVTQFTASQAVADYVYNYNQYRQADNAYIVAKNEYLTYGTLTAKQKALDATKSMITWRNDVIRTYLIALRQTLLETPGLTPADTESVVGTINTQISWVEGQKAVILSAGTLDDLVKLSQTLENKYPELENTYYTALTTILSGRENIENQYITYLTNSINNTITQAGAAGAQTDVLSRWLLEAQTRLDRAGEKHTEALNTLDKITSQNAVFNTSATKASLFNQLQSSLQQENIYLKEAVSYLSETIQEAANAGL